MKTKFLTVTIMLFIVAGSSALYAQMSQGADQSGPPQRGMQMSPEQRLQHMTKQLNLSEDQQQKIKPILEQESQQMQALHQDSTISQQDRRSKMMQIRQDTMSQIKPILNSDQQKKLEDMQSRQGHGGGWGQNPNQGQGQNQPQ
jgi:periplasmic protein CpxP/Spy